jgi:hypothetical protein
MSSEKTPKDLSPDEMQSALFANLVLQQTNMAMMLLGRTPHPESGEQMFDLEAAQFMIDQLEMLKSKTKGNLTSQEDQLLQQSLTSLRMAFVEAVNSAPAGGRREDTERGRQGDTEKPRHGEGETRRQGDTEKGQTPPDTEEASRVKFTKKY